MLLDVFWHAPVDLRSGRDGFILTCDLERVPEAAGVYAFGRVFGRTVEPLYIGRATNLRSRISGHFKGSVRLMKRITDAKIGQKVVLVGEWKAKPGQQEDRALKVIEAALIKYAIAAGHDLFNVLGTKRSVHTITSSGNRHACARLFRKSIMMEHG